MNKSNNSININKLNGNKTTIYTNYNIPIITPINTTSTVTANQEQIGNQVPIPPIENVPFTKECVDENHK